MKVITQLIRHFWERGALSREQADYLLDQGFARKADLPGFVPLPEPAPPPPRVVEVLAPHPLELATEHLEPPPRRPGRGGPKGGFVPEADDLKVWLRKQFARRRRAFGSLVRLAERFGPTAAWHDAAIRIRQIKLDRFVKGLSAALRAQDVALGSLWQAVDPEPFYARMEDATLRGPTVRAFRMLLALHDAPRLGKYAWILRLAEVQAVCNLLQAHRRLLVATHQLQQHHAPTLAAALGHSSPPVLSWALLLLYNAGRSAASAGARHTHEYGPIAPPADDVWQQAWTAALLMEGPKAAQFLVKCHGAARGARQLAWRAPKATAAAHSVGATLTDGGVQCSQLLYCPQGWKMP